MSNLNPARILETCTAFWPSKVLLTAVEMGVFTLLGEGGRTAAELTERLEIHPGRGVDFLDALVALGFLERQGAGASARYANTPETALFLDRNKPSYVGGMPEMLNARLFAFWNHLGEALRTGEPQNETKGGGPPVFEALYADEARLEQFLRAMAGLQTGNFMALAEKFDFSRYRTVVDVGGANGHLARILAGRHPHLSVTVFDLPPVIPVVRRETAGLGERIQPVAGDFFTDPLPAGEVVLMGNVLHDWNEPKKKQLIRKAFDALPAGGALIAIENVIDDERRHNAFGLLMSLNMLIEFGAEGGFDYTGAQFDGWCREAGFARTEVVPLTGPTSAAIAYKQ
jgi:hypothetical protein